MSAGDKLLHHSDCYGVLLLGSWVTGQLEDMATCGLPTPGLDKSQMLLAVVFGDLNV